MLQIPQNNLFSSLNWGRKGDESFSTASATLLTINCVSLTEWQETCFFLNTSLTPSQISNENSDNALQEFQQS